MKEITYWLRRHPHNSYYVRDDTHTNTPRQYFSGAVICQEFVEEWLDSLPPWIRLVVSPLPKRGYTEARRSHRPSSVYIGSVSHEITPDMTESVACMPNRFYFKLVEWK